MKERPILFSVPMVRAILDGRKTQTRRIVKLRDPSGTYSVHDDDGWPCSADEFGDWHRDKCKYGEQEDRLWVRESWAPVCAFDPSPETGVIYRADHHTGLEKKDGDQKWKPSIHMPRWASRITLEITGVRVERLNEITRGDCMSEGCPFANMADGPDPRQWYQELWNKINGPESWAANPWVWVVEFKSI